MKETTLKNKDIKYLEVATLKHIPKIDWARNYSHFKNQKRIPPTIFKFILTTYFKLLFKFLTDTGKHVRLPSILGYVGLFKFVPKKELVTNWEHYAKTKEKVLMRNHKNGPFRPKMKWYRMGSSSKNDLVKVAPDYIYNFHRRNQRHYTSEVLKNTDKLILYPIIQNSRIVSSITQNKKIY